jgi:hypothetical protein
MLLSRVKVLLEGSLSAVSELIVALLLKVPKTEESTIPVMLISWEVANARVSRLTEPVQLLQVAPASKEYSGLSSPAGRVSLTTTF